MQHELFLNISPRVSSANCLTISIFWGSARCSFFCVLVLICLSYHLVSHKLVKQTRWRPWDVNVRWVNPCEEKSTVQFAWEVWADKVLIYTGYLIEEQDCLLNIAVKNAGENHKVHLCKILFDIYGFVALSFFKFFCHEFHIWHTNEGIHELSLHILLLG